MLSHARLQVLWFTGNSLAKVASGCELLQWGQMWAAHLFTSVELDFHIMNQWSLNAK